MILALDVYYYDDRARSVGITFHWQDAQPVRSIIETMAVTEEYVPGEFYKRELPCLLQVIAQVDLADIDTIIVDSHVYLDNAHKPGLGARLYDALDESVPVIGVAKKAFHDNEATVVEVLRGDSVNPLYVSAIGMDKETAAQHIRDMHGSYRIPKLLKELDRMTKE